MLSHLQGNKIPNFLKKYQYFLQLGRTKGNHPFEKFAPLQRNPKRTTKQIQHGEKA